MAAPANWLIFQSDNHAQRFAGCYGHPAVQTPTLDRIAARGVRFDNAYCVSPLCCPARAGIATGRFPHQTGYWDNSLAYDGRVASWMHRLREQGHEVASVGKLHFRSAEDDNGFTEEIAPMHIVGGVGGLIALLRWNDEEPARIGQWELYAEQSGAGETKYQHYDSDITQRAIAWLHAHAARAAKPWALYVSYVSPHPPFLVPQRYLDLYPAEAMALPPLFRAHERPRHPALECLRDKMGFREMDDPRLLQRIAASYCGLVSFLDDQIGAVLQVAEELGLLERTRVLYTSDHGETLGSHGLFGKYMLYDASAKVPLLAMGPDLPAGRRVGRFTSHVDLFPTLVEGAGAAPAAEDRTLPGESLWQSIAHADEARIGFAEYHAAGSRAGAFMLRRGGHKLIHHVGMPAQLFDLERDPDETRDLAGRNAALHGELEHELRRLVDPEAVDRRAKLDQSRKVEQHGGADAIRQRGAFVYTPPPGSATEFHAAGAKVA